MYLHRAKGLVYLANPRTGSRATAQALRSVGFEMVGSHHSPIPDDMDRQGVFAFSTVRDLPETLWSWARHAGHGDVLRFLRELPGQRNIIEHWSPHTLFPHERDSDLLLHHSELGGHLNAVLQLSGLPPVKLERTT